MRSMLQAAMALLFAFMPGAGLPMQAARGPRTVTAAPADVATIAAIVRASYATMSGPASHARQWRRDQTLYMPAATFVAMRTRDGRVEAT